MATITKTAGGMHNPAHPGAILFEMYIKPLHWTVRQEAAPKLKPLRQAA